MEFNKIESSVVANAAGRCATEVIQEISEYELMLIAGGMGDVSLG